MLDASTLPPVSVGQPFDDSHQTARLPDYIDLDLYTESNYAPPVEPWTFQLLPDGLVFESFLAGTKESRLSSTIYRGRGGRDLWDSTLGARVGLLRYGTCGPIRPDGWEVDVEGSGQVRLDFDQQRDVQAADFRAGLPISYGAGPHRLRFGYYHLSSHVGDEFLLKNSTFTRLNYSRDVLYLDYAYYLTPRLRTYAEAGWAFYNDVSEPWEFQFGLDYAPSTPTGIHGAPFFAVNGHLRQEVDFGGALTVQAGWAWRGDPSDNLFRAGLHYYNGESNQFSFFDDHEEQVGFGVWYDF